MASFQERLVYGPDHLNVTQLAKAFAECLSKDVCTTSTNESMGYIRSVIERDKPVVHKLPDGNQVAHYFDVFQHTEDLIEGLPEFVGAQVNKDTEDSWLDTWPNVTDLISALNRIAASYLIDSLDKGYIVKTEPFSGIPH